MLLILTTAAVVATIIPSTDAASFVYPDFNDTQGIIFNQDAATTSCDLLEVGGGPAPSRHCTSRRHPR